MIESCLRPVADELPRTLAGLTRADKLRALGNAVVPAQAALAFTTLWEQLCPQRLSLPMLALAGSETWKQVSETDFQYAVKEHAEAEGWAVMSWRKSASPGKDGPDLIRCIEQAYFCAASTSPFTRTDGCRSTCSRPPTRTGAGTCGCGLGRLT